MRGRYWHLSSQMVQMETRMETREGLGSSGVTIAWGEELYSPLELLLYQVNIKYMPRTRVAKHYIITT